MPRDRREKASSVLSLGCGDGFIKVDLTKSVDAFVAGFFALEPRYPVGIGVVYGDGIFGHLFGSAQEIKPSLAKLTGVISRDYPQDSLASFGFEPVEVTTLLTAARLASRFLA